MTDSFLPPVQDVLPFHQRHTPPLQSGIGSASHATEVASAFFSGLPRNPAHADPCGTQPATDPVRTAFAL